MFCAPPSKTAGSQALLKLSPACVLIIRPSTAVSVYTNFFISTFPATPVTIIMLDPDQNFIGDKELNGINFGIAVLEAADLALLQTQSQEVRESIFDALATYLEEYPEEFAHHLQMTSCVFGYTSLYGVEVTDVREFWSDLTAILEGDTVYQPPGLTAKFDKDSRYNQKTRWLKYAAELLLSGKKPIMIPDACCAGPVYDLILKMSKTP